MNIFIDANIIHKDPFLKKASRIVVTKENVDIFDTGSWDKYFE